MKESARLGSFAAFITGVLVLSSVTAPPCRAQAAGVQAEGPKFRLVRSISGSKGTPQGSRFSMEDPRSVFYIPADHQVIVYMEWDGPIGKHHMEGFWRNPAGKITVMSDIDYEAKSTRFGAYWTLALTEGAEAGNWSLEAHVDGELAGTHAFQILNSAKPPGTESSRKMYTPAQLYEWALQASVGIEKFDRTGQKFGEASGFLLEPGWIVTAFECIDGASKLRVTLSDGTKFETDRLAAWNRRQNWAVLKANSTKLPKLRVADANSWSVGDIASYLEIAAEGNRVIANVSIDGKNTFPTAGMRLNVSAGPTDRAVGAALLNEYGEVIGIVAGGLIPGASAVNFYGLSMSTLNTGTRSVVRSGLVVPVSLLSGLNAEAAGRPLGVLESNGEFLAPVTAARNVVSGELARSMDKKGGISYPTEGGDVFSKKDPTLHVYVLWEGREKTKGSLTMRIFDLDNRLLNKDTVEKPLKFSLNKGEQKSTTWEIGISTLPPGIYRVDVWLNDAPAWRSFFRVSE
jgi:S1-C subfamily serine protease